MADRWSKLRETVYRGGSTEGKAGYNGGDNETTTRNRYVITRFGRIRGVCARVHRARWMFNEADGQSGMRRSVFRRAKQIVEIMAGIQGPSWTTIVPPFFKNARRCLCVVERHRAAPTFISASLPRNVIMSGKRELYVTLIWRIIVRANAASIINAEILFGTKRI